MMRSFRGLKWLDSFGLVDRLHRHSTMGIASAKNSICISYSKKREIQGGNARDDGV